MEYVRVVDLHDPYFDRVHSLLQAVFPEEEVLERSLWAEPLRDPNIRVCAAVHETEVVGATEYRYVPALEVAMTDFTIVGRGGLGVGRFLWTKREADLKNMAEAAGGRMIGMFAEVYDPGRATGLNVGTFPEMHPIVRREVLSHMGYQRLDFRYVHPSWQNDGSAVAQLDLCFLPSDQNLASLPGGLIAAFLTGYYQVLPNKPAQWQDMVAGLERAPTVPLRPL